MLRRLASDAGTKNIRVHINHQSWNDRGQEQVLQISNEIDVEDRGENEVWRISAQQTSWERICSRELGQQQWQQGFGSGLRNELQDDRSQCENNDIVARCEREDACKQIEARQTNDIRVLGLDRQICELCSDVDEESRRVCGQADVGEGEEEDNNSQGHKGGRACRIGGPLWGVATKNSSDEDFDGDASADCEKDDDDNGHDSIIELDFVFLDAKTDWKYDEYDGYDESDQEYDRLGWDFHLLGQMGEKKRNEENL